MKFHVPLEQKLVDLIKKTGKVKLINDNKQTIGYGFVENNKYYVEIFRRYDPKCPICVSDVVFLQQNWCWVCKNCFTELDYSQCIFETETCFVHERPHIFI